MMRGVAAGAHASVGRRVAAVVACAVLVVGGASACGPTTAEPTIAPTSATASPSPTPSPTASPSAFTPVEPTKPSEMALGDTAGAVAAGNYFMNLYNYVIASGDVAEWRVVSDESCSFCANVTEAVGEVYTEDGRFDGGDIQLSDGRLAYFSDALRLHTVEFNYSTTTMRRIDGSGMVVRTTDAESGLIQLDVGFTGNAWRLVGVNVGTAE